MRTKKRPQRFVLANAAFRRLWLAQAISVFGDCLAMFAVQALVVFRMHGSAAQVSAVLLVSLLPAVAIGPFAGVFADRWDPRRTMVASDVLRALLVLPLAFIPAHAGGGAVALFELCAICFAIGCVSAFFVPARGVMMPALVSREEILAASAAMQQTWQLARIASPGIAAALVARFSESACFWVDALSFIFSALIVAAIRCNIPRISSETAPTDRPAGVLRDLRAGVRYLFSDAGLFSATLAMAAGTFAAACYSSLAGVYVRDVLHRGPRIYGALGSAVAVGMLAGSLFVGKLARRLTSDAMIAGGMGVVGVCILLLAASPGVAASVIGSAGIGLGASSALAAASAVLRQRTEAALRGRVVSVSVAIMSGAQAVAILLVGKSAAWIGVRGVFALAAAMLLAPPVCRYFRRGTIRSAPSACFQTLR